MNVVVIWDNDNVITEFGERIWGKKISTNKKCKYVCVYQEENERNKKERERLINFHILYRKSWRVMNINLTIKQNVTISLY